MRTIENWKAKPVRSVGKKEINWDWVAGLSKNKSGASV